MALTKATPGNMILLTLIFLNLFIVVTTHVVKKDSRDCILLNLLKHFKSDQHNKYLNSTDTPVKRRCLQYNGDNYKQMSCNENSALPSADADDPTVLVTEEYPEDKRLWPEIGNGHIATVVKGDAMFMNGLYNGKKTSSHRAKIPSTVAVNINNISPPVDTKKFVLDVGRGVYYERYEGSDFYVEMRMYAHRVVTRAFVVEIIIAETSQDRNMDVILNLSVNNGTIVEDITWTNVEDSGSITVKTGFTKVAEYSAVQPRTPVTVVSSNIPRTLTLPSGISKMDAVFFTSISVNKSEALQGYDDVLSMLGNSTLLSSHIHQWQQLWQRGKIDVEGNITLSRINYASLYYLTSSLPLVNDPTWPFCGLAPGGLAHGSADKDYLGHVFWDQDTWMFPPIMLLHSDLGRIIIETRIRTLDSAKILANQTGYQGARYPWESAFTGFETSPSHATASLEQHITGDVSLAFRQYLQLTNDTNFLLQRRGLEAVQEMAKFWASRTIYNSTKDMYEIKGVMPPDEWNFPVDNSAYTNHIAALSLLNAVYATHMVGNQPPQIWQKIADKMYIPFDQKKQYHLEYDGYTIGKRIKQADVVMLQFPMMMNSSTLVQQNDLKTYEKVTLAGPAMTWGIFTIDWLQLGNKDKADSLFQRTMVNARKPFYVWTENADGSGAVNFHTGMGGYLQAVLFGYAGFRIHDNKLTFNPTLPASTTRLTLTGIDYGGNSFDLTVASVYMTLTPTNLTRAMCMEVNNHCNQLHFNVSQTYPIGKAALVFTLDKS